MVNTKFPMRQKWRSGWILRLFGFVPPKSTISRFFAREPARYIFVVAMEARWE
jgi:hypothetical protein